jgi:hypothetical protein
VPKAAVYENRKAYSTEEKLWIAKNLSAPTPTFDLEIAKNPNQPHFGGAITSTLDAGHHLGALGGRVYIGHRLNFLSV